MDSSCSAEIAKFCLSPGTAIEDEKDTTIENVTPREMLETRSEAPPLPRPLLVTSSSVPNFPPPPPRQPDIFVFNDGKSLDEIMNQMMEDMMAFQSGNHPLPPPRPFLQASPSSHRSPVHHPFPIGAHDRLMNHHSQMLHSPVLRGNSFGPRPSNQISVQLGKPSMDDDVVDTMVAQFFGLPKASLTNVPSAAAAKKANVTKLEAVRSHAWREDVHSIQELFENEEDGASFFVNFCSSACHFCQELMPAWEQTTLEMETSNVRMIFLDCDYDTQGICKTNGVIGTPSLRLYQLKDYGAAYTEYLGSRTVEDLKSFVKKFDKDPTEEHHSDAIPLSESGDADGIEEEWEGEEDKAESDVAEEAEPSLVVQDDDPDVEVRDDVTPLVWDTEQEFAEARRVQEFADNLREDPVRRRLSELKPVIARHLHEAKQLASTENALTCLQHIDSQDISNECHEAVGHMVTFLADSYKKDEDAAEVVSCVLLIVGMIVLFVGLIFSKKWHLKHIKQMHKDRKMRMDVLRTVHENPELKAQVEELLGGETLNEEVMTHDPIKAFRKKLGCMGVFCLTLPRLAILVVYLIAVMTIPSLVLYILLPTLVCMSCYGYVLRCCIGGKSASEGGADQPIAAIAYPATRREDEGTVYEAIPVI